MAQFDSSSVSVHFDAGSGLAHFNVSDGATATRKDEDTYRFVCASPSISEGKG